MGVSSLLEISSDSFVDISHNIVVARQPVRIPGIEGLFIPAGTHGHILKAVGENTALVRWEVSFKLLL